LLFCLLGRTDIRVLGRMLVLADIAVLFVLDGPYAAGVVPGPPP
jgi:hypothetical protein